MTNSEPTPKNVTKLPSLAADKELVTFLGEMGNRVRAARQQRGLSARKLSELSGVSLRYLSLLENGKGNISIALLYKISRALGHRLEWFVTTEDPWVSQFSQLLEAYGEASPEVREQIAQMLEPHLPPSGRAQRIGLIGLRGAGKSSLGKFIAQQLDWPFLELNREIETLAGMSIGELINFYGQEGYRRLEREALDQVKKNANTIVLAVAGGIVSSPETYRSLKLNFHTIWLKATPSEHMERVRAQGDSRPMAGNPAAMEELKSILTSRENLYADAAYSVDTSSKSLQQSQADLMQIAKRIVKTSASD